MAIRALPPGAVRRRTAFGLLDADGWTWAFLQALFWFLLILFMLGYIPDRAYYFTVAKTIDVGFNAVPLLNWCPGSNQDLPCPAPAGSVVPWQLSEPNTPLDLPEGRVDVTAFQSGTNLYLVGGRNAAGPTAEVLATVVTIDGNLGSWTMGPALPAPRADAAIVSLSGVPYVIGGVGADGVATKTVYEGVLDAGVLTGWEEATTLVLPAAMSDAMAVPSSKGLYLIGGRTAAGLVNTVYQSTFDTSSPPKLQAWADAGVPLPAARGDSAAIISGDYVYVIGGAGPEGLTSDVYRLTLDDGLVDKDADGAVVGWATAPDSQKLPESRARASSFTANGAVYVIGGVDANGMPQQSNYWALPSDVGDLPKWSRTEQTDLPDARAGAAITNVGSTAFVIAGESTAGPSTGSMRAGISPAPPYFRFGLFGLTVPALAIQGEIGQQLGYINAFGVGLANFTALVLIGLAFSHRQATMRFIERVTRGRVRAPREDEYPV